ncbi:MAG: hypothetical protein ACI8QZ_001149 [Chlamydiales bacterium]
MLRLRAALVAIVGLVSCAGPQGAGDPEPALVLRTPHTGQQAVTLLGLDQATLAREGLVDDAARFLEVRVADARDAWPAISGSYSVSDGALVFSPRFPWARGVVYTARYPAHGADPTSATFLVREFSLPEDRTSPTTVVQGLQPALRDMPANVLRMYLTFSAPMSRGEAHEHLRMLESDGTPVRLPFLELRDELWDPTRTRLTLLLEPGRIKRGLRPNLDLGPPLLPDRDYTLVVDAGWRDGAGRPLAHAFSWSFHTVAVDRASPDAETWSLTTPQAGSTAPLRIEFDEHLDFFITARSVRVENMERQVVAGGGVVAPDGMSWSFCPQRNWNPGHYLVIAESRIEDLAGNALARPFETPIGSEVGETTRDEPIERHFEVR